MIKNLRIKTLFFTMTICVIRKSSKFYGQNLIRIHLKTKCPWIMKKSYLKWVKVQTVFWSISVTVLIESLEPHTCSFHLNSYTESYKYLVYNTLFSRNPWTSTWEPRPKSSYYFFGKQFYWWEEKFVLEKVIWWLFKEKSNLKVKRTHNRLLKNPGNELM